MTDRYECTGRLGKFRPLKCVLGDHEEAHGSRWGASWYDDAPGAFREEPEEISIPAEDRVPFVRRTEDTRVQFEGGGMRDSQTGKPRFDLLVPENMPFDKQYLTRCARLLAKGADHYEDRNWEKFGDKEALNRARSSAFRHFMQWFTGETDEDHAASVFFNIQAAEYIAWKLGNDD